MNSSITNFSKSASRYIPVEGAKIGTKIIENDYYMTSVKMDGYLSFLVINSGEATLYKRGGEVLHIPQIIEEAKKIKTNVILAGELCCFVNDQSTTHRELSEALDEPDKNDLRFAAFDIIDQNNAKIDLHLKERLELLKSMLNGKSIFAVEQHCFESRTNISDFYDTAIKNGAEGAVVKTSSGLTYKIKEIIHLDLVVIGYAEGMGEKAGQLREVLLGFALGDETFQIVGVCGSGFSDQERKDLPSVFNPLVVHSDFTEVSGAGTAFIFVKPEIVIELSCLDLINVTTDGAIRKAALSYNQDKGYQPIGNQTTLSIITPNFVRLRNDKKANELDAGTHQAYTLLAPIQEDSSQSTDALSEIILREVYVKPGKTANAVRKFIGLKTNKENSGAYSAYVLVFTDFSADRKTPLEQELFLLENEKELNEKLTLLKAEHIKKGWELIK